MRRWRKRSSLLRPSGEKLAVHARQLFPVAKMSEKPPAKLLKVDRQCRRKPRPCRRANDANHHSDLHERWRCPGSAVEFRAAVMRRQRRRLPVLRGALAPSSLELPSRRVTGEKNDSGLLALESPPKLTPGKLEFPKFGRFEISKRCCIFANGEAPPRLLAGTSRRLHDRSGGGSVAIAGRSQQHPASKTIRARATRHCRFAASQRWKSANCTSLARLPIALVNSSHVPLGPRAFLPFAHVAGPHLEQRHFARRQSFFRQGGGPSFWCAAKTIPTASWRGTAAAQSFFVAMPSTMTLVVTRTN
jgi:hypothetical protein